MTILQLQFVNLNPQAFLCPCVFCLQLSLANMRSCTAGISNLHVGRESDVISLRVEKCMINWSISRSEGWAISGASEELLT